MMELIRGKTFIKSSAPITPDKPPVPEIDAGQKEAAGTVSKVPVVGEQCRADSKPVSLAAHKNNKPSNRVVKVGEREGITRSGPSRKLVPKSKTHTGTLESVRDEHGAKKDPLHEQGSVAPLKIKGRLVGSASFSGIANHLNSTGKRDPVASPCQSTRSHKMIDYRNFAPQVPFVPAVAKSIPRKRITLKRSKKGLKDIFHIKKNKQDCHTLSIDKDKVLAQELSGWSYTTPLLKSREMFAGECLAPEFSDSEMHYDPASDYCSVFCEDAASLKSFDSLTGCGEIFADEHSAHVDFFNGQETQKFQPRCKKKPLSGTFQGGMEQLASPAQSEAIDFAKFWGHVNQSIRLHQNALLDKRLLQTPCNEKRLLETPNNEQVKQRGKECAPPKDLPLQDDNGPQTSKDSSPDTETPKSDIQESTSTSDEGYYDSFSPGLDDEKKENRTPGSFPRDSYSGDALYDLFYDHSETQISPVPDDVISLSGQTNELPLSICSFHVGADENMASQPSIDIVSQSFLQSSWKGKECLLKLCDTELSLTMGIINWLRNNPSLVSPIDSAISPQMELREIGIPMALPNSLPCQKSPSEKQPSPMTHSVLQCQTTVRNNQNCLPTEMSEDKNEVQVSENIASKDPSAEEDSPRDNHDTVFGFNTISNKFDSVNSNGQQAILHGTKLRVSSSAIVRGCTSDQARSPHDNRQVMVAIGKDALCPSCRNSLERDQNSLELCFGCMAKLKRTDSMGFSGEKAHQTTRKVNSPCSLPKRYSEVLMSPSYFGRNQTITQILEQCVAQVASLQISYNSDKKNVENKCIGNEMKNLLCKMAQYRKNMLCPTVAHPGHNIDEQENRPYTTFRHNFGTNPVVTQKCRTFIDGVGQDSNEQDYKETFMNNKDPLTAAGDRIQSGPKVFTPTCPPNRPNFLPLFGSFPLNRPCDILPTFCQMHSFQDIFECNRAKRSWEICSQTGLPHPDTSPSGPEATPSEDLTGKTSPVTF